MGVSTYLSTDKSLRYAKAMSVLRRRAKDYLYQPCSWVPLTWVPVLGVQTSGAQQSAVGACILRYVRG